MSRFYSSIAMMLSTLLMTMLITVAVASPVSSGTDILGKRTDHSGDGTWFSVGLGNCGDWDVDSTPVVAIAKSRYNANGGDNCGQWVEITANGKTAYGITKDSCQACKYDDLDMSPSLFQKLAPLSTGRIKIEWHFMAKGWHM